MRIQAIRREGTFRLFWDLSVLVSAVASAVVIPLELVFPSQAPGAFHRFDLFVNAVFILDLALNFDTTYTDKRSSVGDRRAIAARYLKGSFVLDLAAAIPGLVFDALGCPFLRLLRLLKLFDALKTLNRIRRLSVNPSVLRMGRMAFWLAAGSHFIACGFLYVGGIPAEGTPGLEYLRSLYWTITTVATIGYGDITPDKNNPVHLGFAIVTELIGVGMYAFVIGNISSVIANMDMAKSQHRAKTDALSAFLIERSVPVQLRQRVADYFDYIWETRRGQGENEILAELPLSLKTQVSLFLNKDIIEKVPLFQGASPILIEEIVTNLRAVVFLPGDYIVRKGEIGEDMFFISQGAVDVVSEDERTVYATLSAGQFFGEMALLLRTPRTATIKACGYCDIYTLRKAGFERILERHPDFAESIKKMAEERLRENVARS